jgi:hypothetical protein
MFMFAYVNIITTFGSHERKKDLFFARKQERRRSVTLPVVIPLLFKTSS